jgi:AcrR family transcriptional regulator
LDVRSDSQPEGQGRVSFIESARRKQIVDTAIHTIAEHGYNGASLAEIARRAGISKGLISYHFQDKDELVEEILTRLLREPADHVKHRVDQACGAVARLDAYVNANFDFMKTHRNHYVALVDLWGGRVSSQGHRRFDADAYEPSRHYLARIIEDGIARGELREASPMVTASVIQAAIDGVMLQWVFDEKAIDLDACSEEIQEMIRRKLHS